MKIDSRSRQAKESFQPYRLNCNFVAPSRAPMTELSDRLQQTLGSGYRVIKELGGGGMSRVFAAEEIDLERPVVIKVLPPDLGAGLNVERFRREIQLAAKLQHPHIVPLLSAGAKDGLLYYTMPHIDGDTLRSKLRSGEMP